MCAFNCEKYIAEAIESVLSQTFQDWELIVIDDASNDKTEEIINPFLSDARIRYIKNPLNLGLARNRIRGIEEVRGEYIAILDSDDRWNDSTKLEKQCEFLDKNPECGVIGTFANVIDKNGNITDRLTYKTTDKTIRRNMLFQDQIVNSSSLFRTSIINEIGNYDPTLAPAEDYDLFLRIGAENQFANLPFYMTDYRVHPENSSSNNKQKKLNHAKLHLKVIKKFKNDYPNYFPALIKSYLRILKIFVW